MRSARTRSLPVAVLIAAIALLVSAGSAAAATIPIKGGEIDWGIKESFRAYVKGPAAQGQIEVSGGATEAADGTYVFPVGSGSYDTTTHVVEVQGSGTVHFTGHFTAGVPALDMTVTDPRVVIDGAESFVFADVTSKSLMTGETKSYPDAEFAQLDASLIKPAFGEEDVKLKNIPAELTAEGAEAFAGFYPAGTKLDPLSLTASFKETKTPEEPKEEPKTEAPKKEDPKPADPPPSATMVTIPDLKELTGGPAKVGRGGSATLATLTCPTAACELSAPKTVKFKIGGKSFTAKVNAPKWIHAGKTAKVAVKLPNEALEELGDGTVSISFKLVLGSGSGSQTKLVKATLKANSGGKH